MYSSRRRNIFGPHSRARFTVRGLLSVVLVCALTCASAAWWFREVGRSRWHARASACRGNLYFIGLALRNYHEIYGSFPPAYSADKEGKPLCSWRVMLLAADPATIHIYKSYNLNEPWDGPNNRKLAPLRPSFYSCENDPTQDSTSLSTSYLALIGPGLPFRGGEPIKTDDLQGDLNQHILIAEVANSGINWMEPRDLDVGGLSSLLNLPSRPNISSNDPGGPGVIFADGRVNRLGSAITRDALKTMTKSAGGGGPRGSR